MTNSTPTLAILTEDGFLLLEVDPGIFSDGDLTLTREGLSADGISYEEIENIEAHPRLNERAARIRRTMEPM